MTSAVHAQHSPLVFVGSAVRAAGYRLGGFTTLTPEAGHEVATVERALKSGAIVVLDPALVEALPAARLQRWLAHGVPPVVIAPVADGTSSPADPSERVRLQLGLDA